MSDEEFRRAIRDGNLERVTTLALRMPDYVLREEHAKLLAKAKALDALILAVHSGAPLCWCGVIGEPRCPKHEEAVQKYFELKTTWFNMGMLARWMAGDKVNEQDRRTFIKAWHEAGCPGNTGRCGFPECPGTLTGWYCSKHHIFIERPKDMSRERGSQ